MKKVVLDERTKNLNADLQRDVAHFEETIRELCKQCWEIIQNKDVRDVFDRNGDVTGVIPAVSDSDKLRAIEILAKNMKMLLDVKFDAGIFKKKLGEMEIKSFNVFVDLVKEFSNNGAIAKPPRADQAGGDQPNHPVFSKEAERLSPSDTRPESVEKAGGDQ